MLDMNNFAPALKQLYPDWKIEELTYRNNPFYALMPKFEGFYGEVLKHPLIFANSQNVSSTFATALAGTSYNRVEAFLVTRKQSYSLATLSNEVLEASQSNEGAFLEAAKLTIDGALNSLARKLSIDMYRTGSGSLGKVGLVAPSTTIVLKNVEDAVNFEVGQSIVSSTVDGGGAIKPAVTITAIDRVTGTITPSADVSGGGYLWAASDYIFKNGDYDACISGLQAWLPYDNRTAKLAASFYNVTRNVDGLRLGGITNDISAMPIEEGLIDSANIGAREGAQFDYCFMNPQDMSNLIKSMGSKVQRTQVSAEISEGGIFRSAVGFNAIEVYYAGGSFKVIGDRNCPKGRTFLVQMDTWKFASLGKAVRLFEGDGLKLLRSSTADALDLRCYSYANVVNSAPGWNMQLNLV